MIIFQLHVHHIRGLHISEYWINQIIFSPTAVAKESPGVPLLSGSCTSSTWPAYWNPTQAQPPLPHLPQTPELLEPSYRRYFIIFTNIFLYIKHSIWVRTGQWQKFHNFVRFGCLRFSSDFDSVRLDIDSFWYIYISDTVHDYFSEGKTNLFQLML